MYEQSGEHTFSSCNFFSVRFFRFLADSARLNWSSCSFNGAFFPPLPLAPAAAVVEAGSSSVEARAEEDKSTACLDVSRLGVAIFPSSSSSELSSASDEAISSIKPDCVSYIRALTDRKEDRPWIFRRLIDGLPLLPPRLDEGSTGGSGVEVVDSLAGIAGILNLIFNDVVIGGGGDSSSSSSSSASSSSSCMDKNKVSAELYGKAKQRERTDSIISSPSS